MSQKSTEKGNMRETFFNIDFFFSPQRYTFLCVKLHTSTCNHVRDRENFWRVETKYKIINANVTFTCSFVPRNAANSFATYFKVTVSLKLKTAIFFPWFYPSLRRWASVLRANHQNYFCARCWSCFNLSLHLVKPQIVVALLFNTPGYQTKSRNPNDSKRSPRLTRTGEKEKRWNF